MSKYAYYAILMGNRVVIRRTLNGLKRVKSVLSNPKTGVYLEQVVYTGGLIAGTLASNLWGTVTTKRFPASGLIKLTRDEYVGLKPYMQ